MGTAVIGFIIFVAIVRYWSNNPLPIEDFDLGSTYLRNAAQAAARDADDI